MSLNAPGATESHPQSEHDGHSTLEPVQDYSTLEADHRGDEEGYAAKEVVHDHYNDLEVASEKPKSGFWKRRVCGLSMIIIAIIAAIIIIGAVGGGVGGALASKNNDNTISPSSTTTSATPTATAAPTETSALGEYPAPLVLPNYWHKIGNPHIDLANATVPWQLEGRWQDRTDFGSVGLNPNSTLDDQTWQLLAIPQSSAKSKLVFDNLAQTNGTPTSLYYIACKRFGQDIKMAVDNRDVELYKDDPNGGWIRITLARVDDEDLGQYWWLESIVGTDEGRTETVRIHNLKTGKGWALRGGQFDDGNGLVVMTAGIGDEGDDGVAEQWDVTRIKEIGSQEGWFIYEY